MLLDVSLLSEDSVMKILPRLVDAAVSQLTELILEKKIFN